MNNKMNKIIILIIVALIILAIFILVNKNGNTVLIKLKGNNSITIKQNEQYIEPGYEIVNDSDNNYYVNIDGVVNTDSIGTYSLKYNLYNKNGKFISSVVREVNVIAGDLSRVSLVLNGDDIEYYFVGDYSDKGVTAYDGASDISNTVIVDTELNPNVAGKYLVKYQIKKNGSVKEITREVNIIDLDIKENVIYSRKLINLIVSCDNYAYTLLPNGDREYSKDVEYTFNDTGIYNFDIYLKSGSHKKYSVTLLNVDNANFNGTCSLFFENNTTKIIVNMKDESLVSKYSYNGLDFYDNTKLINGYVGNVTIKVYDYINNAIDIKCKNNFDYSFKTINNNKSGFIKCGTNISNEDKELEAIVQSYGYKTRDAVAAAGLYLVNYKHNIPYFWGGKYVKKGFNPKWGCREKVYSKVICSRELGGEYCELGLDCTGFTSWAFAQAGFDYSIIRQSSQSEGNWGNFNAKAHRFAFNANNLSYINQIKPGDIVHKPNHVGLIIGIDQNTLQIAEMTGPIVIDIIDKTTGASINGHSSFDDFVLFDDFYNMYGN